MIWFLVFGVARFVLAIVDFFKRPVDPPQPRLPDCDEGIFTHEQATRYIAMKAQYGATADSDGEEAQR